MTHSGLGTDELIDLISCHQIIDSDALWQYLAERGGVAGLPTDAGDLVADLVRDQLLTDYQGEQILAGDVDALLVGKYYLLDRLGGLDSSVYLAQRRTDGARFAIKLLHRDPDMPPPLIERFRREAEALARLDHPGIVSIKDSGEDKGRLFLVMEYIDGESLREMVERQGPLDPATAVPLIQAALDALAHIHEAGLVHRNMEPGHLMIDRAGQVRLVDLGLARFLDEPGVNLTMFGGASQVIGAVEFQSQEQILNSHDVDIRTDIYALGATLYYLFTGRAPFSQRALLRLAAGVVTHPQPLSQLRPDLPAELVAVAERMMARSRSERYSTPEEARDALNQWITAVSPPVMPSFPDRPLSRSLIHRPESDTDFVIDEPIPTPEEGPAREEAAIPAWLLAGLLFGATAALALGASAMGKLF